MASSLQNYTVQDAGELRSYLLARLVELLDHKEGDNADPDYPADGLVLDQAAYNDKRARFLVFLTENFAKLYRTMSRLEDKESRDLFVELLLFRALGHERVRLNSNTPFYWSAKAECQAMPSSPSELASLPGGAGLKQFRIEQNGKSTMVDCWLANVFFTFKLRQYYFERDAVAIRPERDDAVVDAGACFGDTAIGFAQDVGPNGRVYAFDPLETHLQVLNRNVAQNGIGNVLVFPTALGEANRIGVPAQGSIDPGFSTSEGPVRSLDGLVAEGSIPHVDFLKMDIEGHELEALRGAEATLRRFRPKLAISVYHRWGDYFDIPDFIHDLGLGYRFHLANYTVSDGETVLYCDRPAR